MPPKISRTLMKLMDFNGAGHKDAAPSVVEKFAADKARLLSSRDVRAARIKREQADVPIGDGTDGRGPSTVGRVIVLVHNSTVVKKYKKIIIKKYIKKK